MPVGVAFTLETKQVRDNLARLGQKAPQAAGQALRLEGESIMTLSKSTYVPVHYGVLRASGFVDGPKFDGAAITVTLGFGGPSAPYALAVHEIPPPPAKSPGGRSARHEPPTQWKYLERPFLEAQPGLLARIGQRLQTSLTSGML